MSKLHANYKDVSDKDVKLDSRVTIAMVSVSDGVAEVDRQMREVVKDIERLTMQKEENMEVDLSLGSRLARLTFATD
jgi:uncharacterized protein YoxC